MTTKQHWILPEGIEEVLPEQAARFEMIRRLLLDMYAAWGYELVIPPTIDFIDSLLTGTGHDLDLQTFKLVDQLSGRTLGIRADMTPQVARIEAHQLQRDVPTRLCYIGTVLHTVPECIGDSRSPMQVGAELYGHAGVESEVEIIGLMLQTFSLLEIDAAVECGKPCPHGHVAAETPRPNTFWQAFHQSYREKLAAMTLAEVLAYESNLDPVTP